MSEDAIWKFALGTLSLLKDLGGWGVLALLVLIVILVLLRGKRLRFNFEYDAKDK